MSTRIVCPNCHTAYNATDDQRGRRVRCKHCQAIFHAAAPQEAADLSVREQSDGVQQPTPSSSADELERGKREEGVTEYSRPRKKAAARKISALVLLLLFGGVGGSLLIVVGSIFVCLWLWQNPPDKWGVSKASHAGVLPGGVPDFAPGPDFRGKKGADGDGKDEPANAVEEPPQAALPPLPKEIDFASPTPKVPDPAAPAKASTNPQLPLELVQKVKRATAYLRVTLSDGTLSQGSGFFGAEPGLVLTNAHVIGMLRPQSRPPRQIEVILNSGAAEERKLGALLLGVDRHADLAVLRVVAPDLPAPLPVRSARKLQETQQVYVFGFPFGAGLGKEITVSQSSVSSLRWENGVLVKVQVNGGMHPGNSGGPVVDANGNVVGVAVSVLRNTQINFAVPGDQVYAVLHGRLSTVSLGQPYRANPDVHVPVTLRMIDPLARIREPALEVWTGEPSPAARQPSVTQPPLQAGDSPHQPHALAYGEQTAHADIPLPSLPPGKVYWVQPKWINAAGETLWATAQVYPLPSPVERKPVALLFRHQTGSRGLTLNCWLDFTTPALNGAEHTLSINSQTSVTETTEAVDAEELASVHLQYQAYNVKVQFSGDNQNLRNSPFDSARQAIKNLAANLRIDKQGNLVGNQVDLGRVPAESQPVLTNVHEDLQRALVSMTAPLPNKRVEPGETWKAERTLPIPSLGRAIAAPFDLTCTYLGTRERAGHEEAVLDIQGEFRATGHQAGQGIGRADGVASVDLTNGQVSQADMVLVFDVETNPPSRLLPSHGKLTLRLQRESPPGNPGD